MRDFNEYWIPRIRENKKIKGEYSCNCHLFESIIDALKAKNQRITTGMNVKNRCTSKKGIVVRETNHKSYILVKYSDKLKDCYIEHVQELIIINL